MDLFLIFTLHITEYKHNTGMHLDYSLIPVVILSHTHRNEHVICIVSTICKKV